MRVCAVQSKAGTFAFYPDAPSINIHNIIYDFTEALKTQSKVWSWVFSGFELSSSAAVGAQFAHPRLYDPQTDPRLLPASLGGCLSIS